MGQISVIIISWNARGYLRDCLNSVRQTGNPVLHETIVVDNCSSDGSPEMVVEEFPEVKLIRANENLGFARANNLGMQQASGSLFALINSDVIVHPECLQKLAALLESRPDVGLVGPKILGGDGRLQYSCGQLPTVWNTACRYLAMDKLLSRWSLFSGLHMRHWNYDNQAEIGVLSGCFWLARRAAVDQVGGLDERFFFYAEDTDWCKRFWDAGWKIVFAPEATATHFGGGSSSNAPLRYSVLLLKSNLVYWQKHHGTRGRLVCYVLAMVRHCFRFLIRGMLRTVGLAGGAANKHKLQEDIVCLKWLLTGKGL
jgi:GT2 family glycosyltransferase